VRSTLGVDLVDSSARGRIGGPHSPRTSSLTVESRIAKARTLSRSHHCAMSMPLGEDALLWIGYLRLHSVPSELSLILMINSCE